MFIVSNAKFTHMLVHKMHLLILILFILPDSPSLILFYNALHIAVI